MSKKLIIATILIIVGEILSLIRVSFIEEIRMVSDFIPTIILIISIILEIIGVILLLVCIANYDIKEWN